MTDNMLPDKYKWLEKVGTLPKLLSAGLQYLGLKEIPGSASNPVIMQMAKELKCQYIYNSDEISWCALFINYLLHITGKPPVDLKGDAYNILRAKWLLNWGNEVPINEAKLGDIVILNREGGGHVCIYIAETQNGFIGFGGNQSNSATFSEFKTDRIIGVRNYYSIAAPESAKRYFIDGTGHFSTNES